MWREETFGLDYKHWFSTERKKQKFPVCLPLEHFTCKQTWPHVAINKSFIIDWAEFQINCFELHLQEPLRESSSLYIFISALDTRFSFVFATNNKETIPNEMFMLCGTEEDFLNELLDGLSWFDSLSSIYKSFENITLRWKSSQLSIEWLSAFDRKLNLTSPRKYATWTLCIFKVWAIALTASINLFHNFLARKASERRINSQVTLTRLI